MFSSKNKKVKTVYQDKTLNFSGTEYLPIPTKAPTREYSYEFVGWDKNNVDEKGNTVVKAIYFQKVNEYNVNFFDDDKTTLLKSAVVQYGATVDVSDIHPTKPETKEFSYEFVGWDKDIDAFTDNTNVYAVYNAIPKKFTCTFLDSDGVTIIKQFSAIYGTPISAPNPPAKADNGVERYEFFGWKNFKEDMVLTKDVAFEAIYKVVNIEEQRIKDELEKLKEQEKVLKSQMADNRVVMKDYKSNPDYEPPVLDNEAHAQEMPEETEEVSDAEEFVVNNLLVNRKQVKKD